MYDVKSLKAEEFINDEEIQDCLRYARENKNNRELVDEILKKAENMKGISHREAAVLLECDLPDEIGQKDQRPLLRQPHRYVCAAVSLELLCQRLHLLSLSCKK